VNVFAFTALAALSWRHLQMKPTLFEVLIEKLWQSLWERSTNLKPKVSILYFCAQ
jgi:hypothetical protein